MQKFKITAGTRKDQKEWPKASELDLAGLKTMFESRDYRAKKDGLCFVPAELVSADRKKTGVKSVSMLVYDIDSGQPSSEIVDKLNELGVTAFIYSSFSHLTSSSVVKTDMYYKWARKTGAPLDATPDSMLDYLREVKGARFMSKNPVWDNSIENAHRALIQTSDGNFYTIDHDPIEKYRIVLPLNEPINLMSLSPVTGLALAAFVAIYHGVGRALGFEFDEACSDPSRLYYWPSSPNGAEVMAHSLNADDLVNANLLDWKAYPRYDPKKESKAASKPKSSYVVADGAGAPVNLLAWDRENHDFDIENLLRQCLPEEMLRNERSNGGFHVECPFEHEHTTLGQQGTFCANGDGDKSWIIFCSHNSCQSAERRKLDFLAEYMKHGYITAKDLGIEPAATPPDVESVAKAMNVDISTLPVDLGRTVEEEVEDPLDTIIPPEDVKLDEDTLIEECLVQITESKTVTDIRKAMSRLVVRSVEIPWEYVYEAMGRSAVKGRALQKLVYSWERGAFAINSAEALGGIRKVREDIKTVHASIEELFHEGYKGRDLHDRLDDVAGHYLMDNGIVRQMFSSFEQELRKQEFGPIIQREVDALNKRYAKMRIGNGMTFLDMDLSRKHMTLRTTGPDAMFQMLRNRNITIPLNAPSKSGKKEMKISAYETWTESSADIKEYDGITFEPGSPEEVDGHFNLWSNDEGFRGFPVFPKKGDCEPILKHIREEWCLGDEQLFNWVIMWLAAIFQRPWYKPSTALALLGQQGTGKSIVFQSLLSKMLGRYYGASGAMDDIVGRFSGHLFGKLLWLSEETLFSGDKKGMNRLKDRISSNTLDMERKHMDKILVKSFTRFVFTSNQDHALHLEQDDRRFCVLQIAGNHAQDAEYFDALSTWMEANGAAYFMDYLMNFKPSDHGMKWEDLEKAPMTAAKAAQAAMSTDAAEDFFLDILRYGRITSVPTNIFSGPKVSWPLRAEDGKKYAFIMKPENFKLAYEEYLRHRNGGAAKFDSNKFQRLFTRFFGANTREYRDFIKTTRIEGNPLTVRMVCLEGREDFINAAVKMRWLSAFDRQDALDSPDSHVYGDSDVL